MSSNESTEQIPTALAIGGRWRDATGALRFDVHNPATGAVIARVADASVEDGIAAVAAAHAAQAPWAARAPRERSEILRRTFELMIAHAGEIAELIVRENGKPLAEARGE